MYSYQNQRLGGASAADGCQLIGGTSLRARSPEKVRGVCSFGWGVDAGSGCSADPERDFCVPVGVLDTGARRG